jgi:D-alanine-D-alanine ligase
MDQAGDVWMLEINTMPGFTAHSLVPMAAASEGGGGRDLATLCTDLVVGALRGAGIEV